MEKHKINKILIGGAFLSLFLFIFYLSSARIDKAEHYYLLGKAYETQGYYEKAKASYEKSVAIKPNSIVYNALGNLHYLFGDNIATVNTFEKGIMADKNDVENYFDVSIVYIDLKEYNKAEENLLFIVKNRNTTAPAFALLGTVYIETEKWGKAEDALKKSLELQQRASTYNDLGVVYEKTGKLGLAVENYQKALQLDPDFRLARNNIQRLS